MKSRLKRPECPASALCVLTAGFVVLVNNRRMFGLLADRIDLASVQGIACFLAVFLGFSGMLGLGLLLVGHKYVLKPAAIALLMLSAVLGYFTQAYGVVFDPRMIQNIAETFVDDNRQEALELLSAPLALRVFLFGLLPSLAVLMARISWKEVRGELRQRSIYAGVMLAVFALLVLPNHRYMLYVARENVRLKYYATPTHALNSLRKYVTACWAGRGKPFVAIGQDAVQVRNGRARTIGILVVGETARADHFSLNGYPRKTNPRLEQRRLLNYTQATSSGTSTAYSVPCMFSFLTKDHFSTAKGARQSNVLDVLHYAGVKVVWIDNNSSDKGVCVRLGYTNLRQGADSTSPFYNDGGYYDEFLVEGLEKLLDGTEADVLIVLHAMGSHGPAYHRRYPAAFAKFQPSCQKDAPHESSVEEVVNAYDNTILYTDYVLDRLIGFLETLPRSCATFLLYASDHGESLGENGVYLHGLPEAIAPAAQTHIPMLLWLSDRYSAGHSIDHALLEGRADAPTSHDNIPHTLLGLFDVRTSLYRADLDLLRTK
ncbi:MAG: phosphoethanolamine--lipid A transferase [Planctomycetes bacterium]|nr:phosphoethanolamine--lipid A transferase [Planctomycetota bacterium]